MSEVILPNKSKGAADDNDFSDVYENDVAIKEVVEALTDDNIAAGAGIVTSKLAGVLAIVTGINHNVNFGSSTLEFVNSRFSDTLTLNHGLGGAPSVVLAVSSNPPVNVASTAITATTFSLRGYNAFGEESHSDTVYWIALG